MPAACDDVSLGTPLFTIASTRYSPERERIAMKFLTTNGRGILLCLIIAIPAWILGTLFPIIGGPVIAILLGMLLAIPLKEKGSMAPGIQFTSKKILQWAVILLGFGLDLTVVLKTGQQSLPIILCTITVSLLIAFLLYKVLPIPAKSATLIGVGSSICGLVLPLPPRRLLSTPTTRKSPNPSL